MMASSRLCSGSVKHTPAASSGSVFSGQIRPLQSSNTCRFGYKRPPNNASLRAQFQPSSTVATAKPSPPSDFESSPVPLLLVPQILLDKDEYDLKNQDQFVFYSLSKQEIVTVEKNQISWRRDQIRDAHWVGSSKGWVMLMNRSDCNLYLSNPFSPTASPIIPLPPIETLPYVTARHFRRRGSESGEFEFEFLLNEWCSESEENNKPQIKKWFEAPLPLKPPITASPENLIQGGFITKMVLSSPPPSPANQYDNFRNCVVAIVYGLKDRLAICRLGDKSWTPLDGEYYREIAFSRRIDQKLCLYTYDGDFRSCRLSNTKSFSPEWRAIRDLDYEDGLGSYFLVESATEPEHLLVVRSSYENDVTDVHKLNLSGAKRKWERVECMEDQALFVGDYSETLAVPAARLPARVKPNCIYFTKFDPFHLGVFRLKEKKEDLEAFDDGIWLDLCFKEDHEDEDEDKYWLWKEKYRKGKDGRFGLCLILGSYVN